METRLSLRRRLLRIDTCPSDVASPVSSRPTSSLSNQVQELEDEEGDELDEESGDDNAMEEETDTHGRVLKPGEKYPPSSVVKLVFSRTDPLGRNPTVCFDYPRSLGIVRDYSGFTIATVDAQQFQLLYRTSWERNCVKNAFSAAGFFRTRKKWTTWHMAWAKPVPKTQFERFRGDHPQMFNHFPDPWVIGRKDRLMKMLANYRRRFGASFDFFPEGFSLPDQLDAFRRALERNDVFIAGIFPSVDRKEGPGPLWISKPPASACGRGIRVLSHRDAWKVCENARKRKNGKAKARIVQQYVADPLLLDNYKFDLRLYVVVTSLDPLRIYLFQEGIARFCTAPYSLKTPKNRFAHLTNYAINKTSEGFVENSDADAGSKWSLAALIRELQSKQLLDDPETLMSQIRAIICKTIIAAEAHLTPLFHQFAGQSSCYELFGFDLLLDMKLRPWLIEVNVSPSLMGGSPLDRRVKGLLLSDTLHLVGLQVPLASIPREKLPAVHRSVSGSLPSVSIPPQGGEFRRRKTMRATPVNRQLHEVVQDPAIEQFNSSHLDLFTTSDWDLVRAMDDEMDRRGHFERIFPAFKPEETASYSQFFTCQRYANSLCAKWLQTPRAARQRLVRQQSARSSRPLKGIPVQSV